jgi:hypothetical protein
MLSSYAAAFGLTTTTCALLCGRIDLLTFSSPDAATVAPGLAYHGPRFWKAVAPISQTRRGGFCFCEALDGGSSSYKGRAIMTREVRMKVSIKDLSVDMEIKNTGVELDVYSNDGKHLGDLIVTKTGLIWCKGSVPRKNGAKASWDQFIEWMQS